MWQPFTTPVRIETVLPVEEVSRRLRAAVVLRVAFWELRAEHPVAGVVEDGSCVLYVRPGFFSRNSFRRVLALEFVESGSGTVLAGCFRLEKFTLGFICVWFGMLAFMTFGMLVQSIKDGRPVLAAIGGPMAMGFFGAFLVGFGVFTGSFSEYKAISFVEGVLKAHERSQAEAEPVPGGIVIRPRHR